MLFNGQAELFGAKILPLYENVMRQGMPAGQDSFFTKSSSASLKIECGGVVPVFKTNRYDRTKNIWLDFLIHDLIVKSIHTVQTNGAIVNVHFVQYRLQIQI